MPKIDCSNVTYSKDSVFKHSLYIPYIDLSGFDTSRMFYVRSMFQNCTLLKRIRSIILPDTIDATRVMFRGCTNLEYVHFMWNLENVTDVSSMFAGCSALQRLPAFSTPFDKVTTMDNAFSECTSLRTLEGIWSTSNVTDMFNAFYYCNNLVTIPKLDCAKVNSISYTFNYCTNLQNVGGLENIGLGFTGNTSVGFGDSHNLSEESVHNIVNNLGDVSGKGIDSVQLIIPTYQYNNYLTDELKQSATTKGWTIIARDYN